MEHAHPQEARFDETDAGLRPHGDGWYVLNVADAIALAAEGNGHSFRLGGEDSFPEYAVNIRVFEPGQVTSLYHAESNQEDFLVLFGECVALIEGQERRLRQWDFFHAAPGTAHVFVGAGEGPCAILMVGARNVEGLVYPVSATAARHGASVERETSSGEEAYANWQRPQPAPRIWPPE